MKSGDRYTPSLIAGASFIIHVSFTLQYKNLYVAFVSEIISLLLHMIKVTVYLLSA